MPTLSFQAVDPARMFPHVPELSSSDEHAAELPQPVLVIAAGADKIVDVARTRTMAARAGERVRFVELDGLYHEVLNETERERAFAELLPWFDAP